MVLIWENTIREAYGNAKQRSQARIRATRHAGIVLTGQEVQKMEVADFKIRKGERQGLEPIVYMNSTDDLSLEEMPCVRASGRLERLLSLRLRDTDTQLKRFAFASWQRCLAREGSL